MTNLELIGLEAERADCLHPFRSRTAHDAYAVLLEEVDELWDAVKLKQSNPARTGEMRKEAIQVGAMALRFLNQMEGFEN